MMKYTLQLVVAFILMTACKSSINVNTNGATNYQQPHHIKLSWAGSPENSQAVTWRTSSGISKGYLEYVKATASPFFQDDVIKLNAKSDTLTSDDGLWNYHSVNIEGLASNTMYSYRVGDGTYWSAWSEFRTATGENEPFKFLYFGDVQRDIYSLGSRAIRQAVLANPDAKFMIFGGDMVHRGGLNVENWNEFFPAGGWAFENIPTVATPGNHEHLIAKSGDNISPLWFLNFAFPKNGPEGHKEETFYVDYNNVRIISLNLCRYKFPEDRKEIYDWTEERLKEFEGDWVFITHHYGMESSARNRKPGVRFPEFKELYERYQVPIILTGHEHVYARGRMGADYPVYVVSVAGPYQNAVQFGDWEERIGTSLQLYQEIHITPNSIHYVAKTVLGDVYDDFTITKDENKKLTFSLKEDLMPESLIPTLNFKDRYDKELVDSYEADKQRYLQRKKRMN